MFGPLLTLITAPVRLVTAPVKIAKNLYEGDSLADTATDTVRYTVTGRENQETMGEFMDFSED